MFFEKLKDTNGETISETLVATLIAAISMIIFASMAVAAKNIIKSSNEAVEKYYNGNSALAVKDTANSNVESLTGKVKLTEEILNVEEYNVTLYANDYDDSEENTNYIYSY